MPVNFDKFLKYSDAVISAIMCGYMLFLVILMVVLACLPEAVLFTSKTGQVAVLPNFPVWWIRVGCLVMAGVAFVGAYWARSFGGSGRKS